MENFIGAFKKYATFSGRARRKEYWMFYLIYFLVIIPLLFADVFMGLFNQDAGIGILSGIFILIAFLPSIALTSRRLHDTNRTGWWQLIVIIPLIGPLVMIVFAVLKGQTEENRFGIDPKVQTVS